MHPLYLDVLKTLERLDIPYVVIGAFAGYSYGVNRVTSDVDMVVDMNESHIQAIAEAYPSPRYYADPDQMRNSIRLGIMFNIIDSNEATKVDLIPLTMKPGYSFALQRRIRRNISSDPVEQAWFARPEDIIIGKLMAWDEGRSFKHESDIRDILMAVQLGDDAELTEMFDLEYLNDWMIFLSEDVGQFWQNMKIVVGIEGAI
jgi:hypothetical protein